MHLIILLVPRSSWLPHMQTPSSLYHHVHCHFTFEIKCHKAANWVWIEPSGEKRENHVGEIKKLSSFFFSFFFLFFQIGSHAVFKTYDDLGTSYYAPAPVMRDSPDDIGSHADSVTYGDLGTFYYSTGAPDCHRVMPESPEAIVIRFWLYTTSNPDTPQEISRTSATSITNSSFDASRDTKFIIHGYWDPERKQPTTMDIIATQFFRPWLRDMKDALLTHVRKRYIIFWMWFHLPVLKES